LLTVSALFIITLRNLGEIALGFETRGALAAELAITARDDQNRETYDAVLQRVRALPWVESATLGNLLPLSGGFDQMQMLREGDPVEKAIQVSYFIVAPDYFRTLRIPLRRGRDLSDADGPAAPLAGVINEKLARRYWPNEDPLGKQIRLRGGPLFEVIGVVGDSRLSEVRAETTPAVYFHHAQAAAFGTFNLGVLVRTSRDASSATRDLRAAIASTGVPVGEVVALDQVRRNSAAAERMMSLLIGVVAVLSLAISALGLYGVLALSIAQRTREIGIRMALGAIPSNLIRSTMARGATLALAGFVAGSAIVAAGGRLLTPFLFGTRVADPMPWAMVIAFVALSVIAATLVPARRAARVQPAVALRHE
jgi:predicted permease